MITEFDFSTETTHSKSGIGAAGLIIGIIVIGAIAYFGFIKPAQEAKAKEANNNG